MSIWHLLKGEEVEEERVDTSNVKSSLLQSLDAKEEKILYLLRFCTDSLLQTLS